MKQKNVAENFFGLSSISSFSKTIITFFCVDSSLSEKSSELQSFAASHKKSRMIEFLLEVEKFAD